MPHNAEGIRIDPAPSLPCASGPIPAATAAPAPPLDAPDVRSSRHGLRVGGPSKLSHMSLCPHDGVFVLPTITAPAARRRPATAPSKSGTLCSKNLVPNVVRNPAVG